MVNENRFLLYALIMGVFITFLYDILRILRRVIPHGSILTALEDIAFWIYCAGEVFLLMYHESDGRLRWFAVLGAMVGMFSYKKLISGPFVKYVSLLLQKLLMLIKRGFCILFKPFRLMGAKTAHKSRQGGRLLKKKLTFVLKVLKMNL